MNSFAIWYERVIRILWVFVFRGTWSYNIFNFLFLNINLISRKKYCLISEWLEKNCHEFVCSIKTENWKKLKSRLIYRLLLKTLIHWLKFDFLISDNPAPSYVWKFYFPPRDLRIMAPSDKFCDISSGKLFESWK